MVGSSKPEVPVSWFAFWCGMGDLFDLSFKSGLLRLPQSETFFRNLIAYEQCGNYEKHIASYIIFMDSLRNTAGDVEVLVKHGVTDNLVGKNQLVANIFNNLYEELREEQKDFSFARICNDMEEYKKVYTWRLVWFG
ncbi:hypothetical protein AG4045_005142 [Apium graveolens]|uniref:Uncharacterized protein n=1 Tax=Apium graveolens TaxID=4045 RepID=A0A6L5BC48_APIGR|nr:hypothetical protein AG4045_005142 [Apium graveolens]